MIRRREILKTAMALAAGQLSGVDIAGAAAQTAAAGSGPAKPFDYAVVAMSFVVVIGLVLWVLLA